MSEKKKYQIFVSSTYIDMKDERQSAVEAILKAGHIPAGMELFSAGDKSQMEVIKRWIKESDIYMLILGGRYGSIDKESDLSYIELEYNYAVELNKPFFSIVIDDKALDEKVKKDGRESIEQDNPQKLKVFREKVLSKISSFFKDTRDIELEIFRSIMKITQDYNLSGWIRGDEAINPKGLIDEINRLTKEKNELENENKTLSKKIEELSKKDGEFTNDELITILKNINFESEYLKDDEGNKKNINLFIIFKIFSDGIISGIYNKKGMDIAQAFLYYEVCPKLEKYGLAVKENINNAQFRMYTLTHRAKDLLAIIEAKQILEDK